MADVVNVFVYAEPKFAQIIRRDLLPNKNIVVVGTSGNTEELKSSITYLKPTIVLLVSEEVNSEKEAGLLSYLKTKNISVIVVCNSVKEGFAWLKNGAVDMIVKPRDLNSVADVKLFINSLAIKIVNFKRNMNTDKRVLKNNFGDRFDKVIAIGSSTGGTEAVFSIIKSMPKDSPPILVVQHMPPVFTKLYAERMHNNSSVTVWEAQKGDVLKPGLALIAPGEFQMTISRKGTEIVVDCFAAPKRNGHCPSADVLFDSVADTMGRAAIGIILTGMGNDGAEGLLRMRKAGATTIGQNEVSCVVYGMPKVAYDIGAVQRQVHLDDIPNTLMTMIRTSL